VFPVEYAIDGTVSNENTVSKFPTVAHNLTCVSRKALSTLSQKSATVAVFSPFSATVSLFCDSEDRA